MARLHLLSLSLGDNWPLIFTLRKINKQGRLASLPYFYLAGREGFEPSVEFKARQSLSRRSRSSTPAPPRVCGCSPWSDLAEGEGFEPTLTFAKPVFKTGALNHSATLPFSRRDCHFIMVDLMGKDFAVACVVTPARITRSSRRCPCPVRLRVRAAVPRQSTGRPLRRWC